MMMVPVIVLMVAMGTMDMDRRFFGLQRLFLFCHFLYSLAQILKNTTLDL
jgi:hypothetical protein